MARLMFLLALILALSVPAAAQMQSEAFKLEVAPEGMPPLHVYVEEMGSGPPVLMLHGLGASSYTWRRLAERLAPRHRLIAIDLRGHGRTDKPYDQHYSPAEHAAVVHAFMRRRGLTQVSLVGHSFGSFISLLLAIDPRSSPRIKKLVLMSTPAYRQPFSPAVWLMQQPVLPYLTLMTMPPELPTAIALFLEKSGWGRVSRRDIEIYADPLLEPGGPHALIATSRQLEPPDLDEIMRRYRSIRQPTLLIHCRHDDVVPITSSLRLSLTMPRARLQLLDDCAHIPPEQATPDVARLMAQFLAR